MSDIRRRIKALEEQSQEPGGLEFVGFGQYDWTEEDLDRAEAEARERVGPNGTVIRIIYTNDWRRRYDQQPTDQD